MEKENCYLLLELPFDPPENDPKIIEEAIKKKQTEWSRNRNHPTKAILSKRYISLIPDIRKIMTDDELRQEEALRAKEMRGEKEKVKFSNIDRHLSILMAKGTVTKKEIAKLAKMHTADENKVSGRLKKKEKFFKIDRDIRNLMRKGDIGEKKIVKLAKQHAIGQNKIREWIKKTGEEIASELDNGIRLCTEKGYITEGETTRLAKLFAMDEPEILMRAKCPIKKEVSPGTKTVRTIEKTLEKLINDNLRIIGKSNLYDFLGRSPQSDLKGLQEKAREKEMEIRKIGQKDANTTASGALTGHCIVIFKSKENRKAYDLTLARSRLTELNTDINAAGIDGKIRDEYLSILLRTALTIGMDLEEAYNYIREYCQKEKWIIKEKKKPLIIEKKRMLILEKWEVEFNPRKKSFWVFVSAMVASILIIVSGTVISGRIIRANRLKNAYQHALVTLEKEQVLEKKEKALQDFVNRYGETEYAVTFENKLRNIRKQIEERDFKATKSKAQALYAEKKFEEMKSVYEWYAKKYPKSARVKKNRKKTDEIPALIEQRDYEALRSLGQKGFAEKIEAYKAYFEKYPEGRHINDVKKLISNMIGAYYDALKKELKGCESQRDWEKCIQLCGDFIKKFSGTEQASAAEGWQVKYQKRIQYEKDLEDMKRQAQGKDFDYEGAKEIYSEYLVATPEAPAYVKEIIRNEIGELDRKIREYLAEEEEWESLVSFYEDDDKTLGDKVGRFEKYVKKPPPERYGEEAAVILKELQHKKKLRDINLREQRERTEWTELVRYARDTRAAVSDKMQKTEAYISEFPSGMYTDKATSLLNKLKEEKIAEDARLKMEKTRKKRIQDEIAKMRRLIKKAGGRFVENGNGTITDKRTGLMWCTVDAFADLGRCLDYESADRYVKHLTTGGHRNWRLPTADELVGIYKTRPFFPSVTPRWFWSSDLIWHGWKKKAYIITSRQETAWNKDQTELTQCGSVRAVRK
ncbi:DUF1566 domain-containing protein [Desulfococcaceae bacterium HSG8]|nr:DUF1566 domain-containing protein [Desulfococcaceae bacterium HSG8]